MLRDVVAEVRQRHPGFRLETIEELLAVGELRVALEILCDNLLEDGRDVTARSRDRIARIGELLGMESSRWNDLPVG
jgi:hypothetical protein